MKLVLLLKLKSYLYIKSNFFFLYCTVCCNCENLKFATEPSKIFHSVHVTLDDKCMYIQYRERDGSSGGAENGILKRVSFPWRPNFQHFFITSGLPSSSHSANPLFGKKSIQFSESHTDIISIME